MMTVEATGSEFIGGPKCGDVRERTDDVLAEVYVRPLIGGKSGSTKSYEYEKMESGDWRFVREMP